MAFDGRYYEWRIFAGTITDEFDLTWGAPDARHRQWG